MNQIQEELLRSEEKRFKLIKQNEYIALELLKKNDTQETSVFVDEIDKLRREKKELDDKHFMIRKQSLRRYKDMEIKEHEIAKLITLLKSK